MSKIQLLLLGHFDCLLSSGERIVFSMRKAEVLLAYLALAPGIRHPRERLINLLWSDRSEEQARNSLRQCLSAIKKSLGDAADQILHVDRTTVSLRPALIEVDALEFERLATEGDFESLSTASSLYSGELLEGISIRDTACQEWLDSERVRFKRQFIEILANLGETQLISHDFANAIKTTERLVEQDPLGESGWRLLMRSYQGHSDRSHALMAFRRCSEVLQKELGVEPEAETSELQQQIISGQIESGQPAVAENQPDSARDTTEPTSREHSILVLPFKNLSDDPEQQYFSDGLTEGIIMGLSLFPSLRVHSRHSSFAASDQNLSVREIGEKFDSLYVVEGSVRKTADQVRISAQLVDTQTGEQIWGQRFDNEIEDAFTVEDQVTQSIVAIIKGRIDFTDQEVAYRKPAKDMQSYDLLMRGIFHFVRFNPEDNRIGLELMQKCLHGDPENATAHYWMYRFYILDWISAWTSPRSESLSKSGYHISKTIEIEPGNSIFQASYAEYLLFITEFEQAATYADRALKLNPNDTETMATISAIQACLGNVQTALDLADACRRLDPYHPWVDWVTGIAYYRGRKYEDALRAFRNMPNPADEIDGWIAACYQRLGEHDKASSQLNSYLETARKNMAKFPESLEEWKQIWSSAASFRHQKDVDYPFQALCEAGLAEYIETPGKQTEVEDTHNIAVLPFDNLSGDPEQEYFSDGISESIILHLSRFPGLKVKSRNSSFAFKQQINSLGEISKELEVDYIVEGSIRKSNQRIRITVQLIEADNGNQVWGKRYDSEIEDLFDLEEELSRSIAATVTGQIESDQQRIALARGAAHPQAYDLLLQGIYHYKKSIASDTVIAVEKLHQCLELDSSNALAHATLYGCHEMNWIDRWAPDFEASRKLCKEHASKALALNPELGQAQVVYAGYLIFNHDYNEAEAHIKRALEINPNDSEAIAVVALNLSCQGQFEAALEQARLALQLDPYHTWARWILSEAQFFCGLYEDVLDTIADTGNPPGFIQIYKIAANIRLGRMEIARDTRKSFLQHCRESMSSMPRTIDEWLAYSRDNAPFAEPAFNQEIMDCLLQAGLEEEMAAAQESADPEALPSILVLPFSNLSDDPEQEYFVDGITSSLILSLGLFNGINIKSQNSSFAFKNSSSSSADIARAMGVDFLIEGSMRKSGVKIRLSVQLVESVSDTQIWGKQYNAELEDILDLEQELSQTIAGTISGRIGHTIQQSSVHKPAKNPQSYDYLMRGLYHFEKFTAADFVIAINEIEKCIEIDPKNATAHANLGMLHHVDDLQGWARDGVNSRKQAAFHFHAAIDSDPDNMLANCYLAEHLYFNREYERSEFYADRAIELNPTASEGYMSKADLLAYCGRYDEAVICAEQSMHLDPHSIGAGWVAGCVYKGNGDFDKAIKTFRSISHPPDTVHAQIAACFAAKGMTEEAHNEMRRYQKLAKNQMPDYPKNETAWREIWQRNQPFKHTKDFDIFFDQLLQAGLCDDDVQDTADMPSIAVLPFENMSGDPEQEYFSDGITTSIILGLGMYRELTVKSQQSSFAFRDSGKPSEEIALDLAVDYLVEGSIRKSGKRVRVTVQLIGAESGSQIWGKQYDEQLDDIFELEQELSRTIAATISGRIGDTIQQSAVRKSAKNLKSYDYFLRGLYHLGKLTARDMEIAKQQFESCLKIDPENAMAHTNLGLVHIVEIIENWSSDLAETKRLAGYHFEIALEHEPENAIAHAYLAEHLFYTGDYERSEFHADKAIELNPTMSEGYTVKADLLGFTRRVDEAVQYADKCIQLDPHSVGAGWVAAAIYRKAGFFQKAIKTFRSIAHPPASVHALISVCFTNMELHQESEKEMQRYLDLAKQQMPVFPSSELDWRQLWRNNLPYQYDEDFNEFFDLLVQAGLLEMAAGVDDDSSIQKR